MSWRARISRNVKEVRVNFDPKAETSRAVRQYIKNNYKDIKTLNPGTPFMVQACAGLSTPYVYVLFGFGGEKKIELGGLSETEINEKLKETTIMAQYLPRNNFTLDGEFTPQDIDIVDYALLKKSPAWQQHGIV